MPIVWHQIKLDFIKVKQSLSSLWAEKDTFTYKQCPPHRFQINQPNRCICTLFTLFARMHVRACTALCAWKCDIDMYTVNKSA